MSDEKDILFEAVTPLGFHVRVTKAYWELIVNIKHPLWLGAKMMSKMYWKIQMKSARVNPMKMFTCSTNLNVKAMDLCSFQANRQ